jgi:hypothetical protein
LRVAFEPLVSFFGKDMKNTLKLMEKLQSECPRILGAKADVVIRSGNIGGLSIEVTWYWGKTYIFGRAYSSMEINSVVDDSMLVDSFIYECKRQAVAVES